jgi:ABC-type dipeptide/oligopeptide/nickel transport system permease subunit
MSTTTGHHDETLSYWEIVWGQFRRNRVAFPALTGIGLLFLTAVYAPVFSARLPFLWHDATGWSSPWLRGLLFNRNAFSSGIDLFFNLLLVSTPMWIAGALVVRRMARGLRRSEARRLAGRALWSGVVVLLGLYVTLLQFTPRSVLLEYRELVVDQPGVWGFFPPLRIGYDDTLHGFTAPGVLHLLGKDDAGRDIFVRLLYGTRVSLSVGVIAVSIYITIGTFLGAVGGYFGGRIDGWIQRLLEIFLCFPSFFMILTFIGFLPSPSITWMMVIIGLLGWTGPARLVRAEFLRLRNMDFVAAARACGLTDARIIFRHLLPNALGPVLVNATFGVASAILVESSLSFLGFGDPTMPSWGRLLAFGRESGDTRMMLIAGGAIFVTVSVFNLAGEGFRDALDPKLRR